MPITIFTDGASRRNPGPGGWGAIVVASDEVAELGGGEGHTTNNRMELSAVICALEFAQKLSGAGLQASAESRKLTAVVHTDSSYVLNGATKWIHGWKNTGWKTKAKEDVLNKDLWESLAPLLPHFRIEWNLLKGHAGVAGNERCDVIATTFADHKPIDLYRGSLDAYQVDVHTIAPLKADARKLKARKGTAYSYVSEMGGKVMVHKTWAECEARVKGKSGARFKKAFSKDEEESLIHAWSH